MRRRSSLTIRNLYAVAVAGGLAFGAAVAERWWTGVMLAAPLAAPALAGAVMGRRWRLRDLGAGDELRRHELGRRWVWQPAPARRPGERKYVGSQGEVVHVRPWPAQVPTCR